MNGAQSLIASLVRSDVEVCFSNPGTSEMHFVAALDSVPQMRVSQTAQDVGADTADAIAASQSDVPGIATLLLPANTAWDPGGEVVDKIPVAAPGEALADEVGAANDAGPMALSMFDLPNPDKERSKTTRRNHDSRVSTYFV